MAALTAPRGVTRLGGGLPHSPAPMGVKAATKIFKGALVVNDAGVMAPGRTATGLIALGVARDTYDNTSGAAGAIMGEADNGTYIFKNSAGGDEIVAADVGKDCYIVDDQTVAKTSATNTRSIAGKVFSIESTGVAVTIDHTT